MRGKKMGRPVSKPRTMVFRDFCVVMKGNSAVRIDKYSPPRPRVHGNEGVIFSQVQPYSFGFDEVFAPQDFHLHPIGYPIYEGMFAIDENTFDTFQPGG